jgi:hypothetical protein
MRRVTTATTANINAKSAIATTVLQVLSETRLVKISMDSPQMMKQASTAVPWRLLNPPAFLTTVIWCYPFRWQHLARKPPAANACFWPGRGRFPPSVTGWSKRQVRPPRAMSVAKAAKGNPRMDAMMPTHIAKT